MNKQYLKKLQLIYFIKEIKKYYNNPLLKASSLSSTEIPDRDTIPIPKPNEEEYKETSSKGGNKINLVLGINLNKQNLYVEIQR